MCKFLSSLAKVVFHPERVLLPSTSVLLSISSHVVYLPVEWIALWSMILVVLCQSLCVVLLMTRILVATDLIVLMHVDVYTQTLVALVIALQGRNVALVTLPTVPCLLLTNLQ